MKKIVKLTESELTNLIKRILKEDLETTDDLGCEKEYRNPESKSDPYKYKMGVECQWETKSIDTNAGNRKIIKDWISLYENERANETLDRWFPNAKKECSNCKKKKTPIKNDCPKEVDCLSSSSPCKDLKIKACIKSGKTRVKTIDGGIGDCPVTVNCMPGAYLRPKLCDNPKLLKMCQDKGTSVFY
jgi:hypothetical protein